mmetsp:Transcript_37427/g.47723  ORF Transcript_37427/g.47723 Transcript_37427/m.47723 type:complete len:693 (+) Transcript_37427:164-2242(+)
MFSTLLRGIHLHCMPCGNQRKGFQICFPMLKSVKFQCLHSGNSPRLLELVLVRPGESEGSMAYQRSELGDQSLYSGEFLTRHSWAWRLTDKGRDQVDASAAWLKEHFPHQFDRFYCSEYIRAMETAAKLELPNSRWLLEMFLRERDWGKMDNMPYAERMEKLEDEMKRMDRDYFLYQPPGGESMADVTLRVDRILSLMHRELPDKRAILVAHCDVLWALRQRLEKMSLSRFQELRQSPRAQHQLHHGQILIYTRVDPDTGQVDNHFRWMKSVCPWNLSLCNDHWHKIARPSYDNQMLRATCQQYPRMITGEIEAGLRDHPFDSGIKLAQPVEYVGEDVIQGRVYTPSSGTKIDMKKAVVVTKTTRYEIERSQYNMEGEKLQEALARQGINYDKLKSSHEAHSKSLKQVMEALHSMDVETKLIRSDALRPCDMHGCDVVFAAGGDGTFLQTATHIGGCMTPMVGVNTDTVGSQGHLCCCHAESQPQFMEVLHRLKTGDYNWNKLRRLQVQLVTSDGREYVLPHFALNEILLSEVQPSRPCIFDIGIDGLERQTVRSSGVIVCSGTGSTAWFTSASRVHQSTVMKVLQAAGLSTDAEYVSAIKNEINDRISFKSDSPRLGYVVREPIINRAHGVQQRFGHADRISIRSLGWQASLVIDGLTAIPLNFGVQAVLTTTDDQHSIHTIDFNRYEEVH